jgi:hypothetical protein
MTVTNAPSAGKEEIISTLRTHLHAVMRERHAAHSNDNLFPAYQALRQFQSARLASTYADLLADKTTRSAALFFLEDLYGTKDFTQRDADIERIIPIMERLLPVAALHYVSQAIELDALSESLDTAMALRLGEQFTQETYVIAYRRCRFPERARKTNQSGAIGWGFIVRTGAQTLHWQHLASDAGTGQSGALGGTAPFFRKRVWRIQGHEKTCGICYDDSRARKPYFGEYLFREGKTIWAGRCVRVLCCAH